MGYQCKTPGCAQDIWARGHCKTHLENPAGIAREKPLTKKEVENIDIDDYWEWVKIELGLEGNKKITTEKTAHKH